MKSYMQTFNGKDIDLCTLEEKYQNSQKEMVKYLNKTTGEPKVVIEPIVEKYFIKKNKKQNNILKRKIFKIIGTIILSLFILLIGFIVIISNYYDMNDNIINIFIDNFSKYSVYLKYPAIFAGLLIGLCLILTVPLIIKKNSREINEKRSKLKNDTDILDMIIDENENKDLSVKDIFEDEKS